MSVCLFDVLLDSYSWQLVITERPSNRYKRKGFAKQGTLTLEHILGFKRHNSGRLSTSWVQTSVETLAAFASNIQTHSVGSKHKAAYQFSLSDGSVGSCMTKSKAFVASALLPLQEDWRTVTRPKRLLVSQSPGPQGLWQAQWRLWRWGRRKDGSYREHFCDAWAQQVSQGGSGRWILASWHFPTDMWDDNLIF